MYDKYLNTLKNRELWGVALVATAAFLCFWPTTNNGLLQWDDSGYILDNTNIRSIDFSTLYWAFTTFYVNYWAPLTWLSLAVDYHFWGLNPVGYHLTNNILHALNSGLFFLLILHLTVIHGRSKHAVSVSCEDKSSTTGFYHSLLAALIFALHPLRVESVAWATERKDVLCVFFGILAMICYLRYADRSAGSRKAAGSLHPFLQSGYYWLAVIFYCFSLLSKSMLVVLPLILLLFDWFPLERHKMRTYPAALAEKLPFLLPAGFASILTIKSQGESLMSFDQANLLSRFLIAVKSLYTYLRMTVWPIDISPFYVHPGKNIALVGLEYIVPIMVVFAITAVCLTVARRWPVLLTAWLFYLITVFPMLGFTQTGPQGMAARFTYVPSMASAFVMSLFFTLIFEKFRHYRPAVIMLVLAVVTVLLAYCSITRNDISYWKNDIILWTRVIELKPHSSGRAYFQRSYAYLSDGQYQKALSDGDEALRIAISKNYNRIYDIQLLRGRILARLERWDEAAVAYTDAINRDSSLTRAIYFAERGTAYSRMGRQDLADNDFKLATMKPRN